MTRLLEIESVPLSQVTAKAHDSFTNPFKPVVLVVDDERIIADTLAAILELSGYAAMVAYDAASAIDIAWVVPPDLLISDVAMPGMTGVELGMALSAIVPDCKVLLFSGQATTMDLLAVARSAGFDFPALTKPIHPNAMLAQVSAMVPRYATGYLA